MNRKVINAPEIIKKANKDGGMTLESIGVLLEVSQSTVSKWKSTSGQNKNNLPTESQLKPLAKKYGLKMELEPLPEVERTAPFKHANTVSYLISALLIGSLLSYLIMTSLEAKEKFGSYNPFIFEKVLRERSEKYKKLCAEDSGNCAAVDQK